MDRRDAFKISANMALAGTGSSVKSSSNNHFSKRSQDFDNLSKKIAEVPSAQIYKPKLPQRRSSREKNFEAPDKVQLAMPKKQQFIEYKSPPEISNPSQRRRPLVPKPGQEQIYRPEPQQVIRGPSKMLTTSKKAKDIKISSQFEEKPISQLKSKSVIPDQQPQVKLVSCRMGCGRTFNPEVIGKHEKVCKKVFQSKRKQFNSQKQRLVEKDQAKLIKQGLRKEKVIQSKKANTKVPKWKAQSEQFRSILKLNRMGDKAPPQLQKALKQAEAVANGYVKCDYCGRSFNQKAAQRHIPFCADKAKKAVIKKGGKR